MANDRKLGILFIGNSHTYYNDMPMMVRQMAEEAGFDCRVTMIAHGGWFLSQHMQEPEVRFNILCGGYDYVVLQEHAHPFGPVEKFHSAALALNRFVQRAGSRAIVYECWSMRSEPEAQAHMNEVHRRIAEEIGAAVAPVGERWWSYLEAHPDVEMYAEDGRHASRAGSEFAAKCIWETIFSDLGAH